MEGKTKDVKKNRKEGLEDWKKNDLLSVLGMAAYNPGSRRVNVYIKFSKLMISNFQPSHYDAISGIYVGPFRKLEEDDDLGNGSLQIIF